MSYTKINLSRPTDYEFLISAGIHVTKSNRGCFVLTTQLPFCNRLLEGRKLSESMNTNRRIQQKRIDENNVTSWYTG